MTKTFLAGRWSTGVGGLYQPMTAKMTMLYFRGWAQVTEGGKPGGILFLASNATREFSCASGVPGHEPGTNPFRSQSSHPPLTVQDGLASYDGRMDGTRSQPVAEAQTLRRSARTWCPSEKALQHIAAEDARDKEIAALLGECPVNGDDSVFLANEAAAKDRFRRI